ncbi:MAG: YecH family protein [Deltaproteobacteria bacterium]|jgi:probable metal-binding protein|nr:YecH family protein [Deltaproteobacteria bacterium]MBT4526060.1 YecH family protein [Deltaproteobacteria bacterium]
MTKYIHGGEVKRMVLASDKSYTRDSLIQEINDQFGEETRFYSCSAENMTADALISFFVANGKLNPVNFIFNQCESHSH